MTSVKRALLAAAVLVPAVGAAQEQQKSPFNYTYVEVSYEENEYDISGGGDTHGDGLTLSGSVELTDDWHAFAYLGNSDLDFGIDIDSWAIGAGYRYPLRNDIDIYGRVMYIDMDVDSPGPGNADEDGLGLQARIRARINNEFEVDPNPSARSKDEKRKPRVGVNQLSRCAIARGL